jgi:hypothetical protein
VSPDYPYLAIGDKEANAWADTMHYERTGEMIRAGVQRVAAMQGSARSKCLAWLLGFASHVVGDVTIHPVVQMKVGPYAENKEAHRLCEMHQDAYIFQRLNAGGIEAAEYLKSGIVRCSSGEGLDSEVHGLWGGLLEEVHPTFVTANPPDIDKWHRCFVTIVDGVDDWSRLPKWARHVTSDCGLTYPRYEEVKRMFVTQLKAPGETRPLSYDQVFDRAAANVRAAWLTIASGVYDGGTAYASAIRDWNLDTGEELPGGKLTYWG